MQLDVSGSWKRMLKGAFRWWVPWHSGQEGRCPASLAVAEVAAPAAL